MIEYFNDVLSPYFDFTDYPLSLFVITLHNNNNATDNPNIN